LTSPAGTARCRSGDTLIAPNYSASICWSICIDIANTHFGDPPSRSFVHGDAVQYLDTASDTERFTIALCCGSFAYFSEAGARSVLRNLHDRFLNIERVFIWDLPDLDRASLFYTIRQAAEGEMLDPSSQIAIWRSRSEFERLARDAGWRTEFSSIPEDFFPLTIVTM
jgi:hypothetical protein